MHPTAYDNLKTILEGCIYDFEIQGILKIVSRNDRVDLANLSRSFQMGVQIGRIYGKIEINFSQQMWIDEIIFEKETIQTELNFKYHVPKYLYDIGYLQWHRFIQRKIWNVEVQLIEEKFFYKDHIDINQVLHVIFKEGIGEMDDERLIQIIDHFVYIGEQMQDKKGKANDKN